jgi:hypothetical protein
MKDILNKKYSRKLFFSIVSGIAVILILCRYFVLPAIDQTITTGFLVFFTNISDGLLVSLLVTVFIGIFLFWITPDNVKETKMEVVESRAIPELFETSFPTTKQWFYKGGCGRYFRTATLPKMATWARQASESRHIVAVILDPTNDELCESHANYRKGTASAALEEEKWTGEKVRVQLCATIITTLAYQVEEPLLNIELYLCGCFSVFRIDLSTDYVVITKEDRNAPAVVYPNSSPFYNSYKDEILFSYKQAKKVRALKQTELAIDSLDENQVGNILDEIGLKTPNMTKDFCAQVANVCKGKLNPYA